MGPIWVPYGIHGDHMGAIWAPYGGNQMGPSVQMEYGYHMGHLGPMLAHLVTIWLAHMVPIWQASFAHMVPRWAPYFLLPGQ